MLTNTLIRILYGVGGFVSGAVMCGVAGYLFKDKIEDFMSGEKVEDVSPVDEVHIDL